jgi:cell division protease FtsH
MIKTIINEALITAHRDGRSALTYKDFLDATDERTLGLKQPIRSWNLQDRKETAYHEAGHAVAARYLRPEARISKATIIRRGHALGYVQQRPREERTSLYARSIETSIMVSLAGHVIENRFLDSLTTGPSFDLRSATEAAFDYVGELAMGPTKVVLTTIPPALPPQPVIIGAHDLLDQLYDETDRLLREKEPALHHLAKALIERDELIGDELEDVFREVETAHPQLKDKFERRIIPFRNFAPPERPIVEGWAPPAAAQQEAAAEPAASVPGASGVPVWEAPIGDRPPRVRRDGPGMPTDIVPPWAQ